VLISRLLLSSAIVTIFTSGILAQQPASRIAGPIDDSQLVTLAGNTPPAAIAANDRGPVDPALRLTDLILVLRRSPDEQAAFDALVASQYDPASPDYHRWLAPADVAARFGPSAADVAGVSQWLAGHGLTVEAVAPDRMTIRFGGTAAQVQAAFHTTLHNLSVHGEAHVANMADPRIPAALGPVVLGVKALHNFLPRPQHRLGSRVTLDPTTGRWQRTTSSANANAALGGISPDLGITVGSGSNQYTIEDVAPYDFATIYNVLPLWNAGTPIDGTGQTIAIAGTSDINLSDVASFRQVFGLPAGTPPKIVVANGVDPGQCTGTVNACTIDDLYENSLDVEWSGAVARGASIVLVVSGPTSPMTDTVFSSANYVVQNQTARILSVSYGECELGLGTAGNAAYNNLWETAATEGIAVFVASGDSGSATCDQGLAQSVPYTAQYGLTVSGLASTPFNTAVGGTDLNWGTTAAPYWNSSNNSSTGASAAGYMPEVPWNDTCSNPVLLPTLQSLASQLKQYGYGNPTSPTDGESACNFVNQWYSTIEQATNGQLNIAGLIDTVGGGGGASNCTASDGTTVASCTGGYAKPGWQAGVSGIPTDGKRDLPDVSFFSGNGLLGSAYLVCVSAAGSCVNSTSPTTEPVAQEVGGTSAGTPAMAGVMALINQKMGATQGSPNAELYSIAAKQSYGSCSSETAGGSCSFHDVDQGTIAMPCASGSLDCTVSHSGDNIGLLSGYNAGAGFDNASGLGSLNVANVVNAWTSTVGTTPATVTVKPAQNSIAINQSLSVAVEVSGSSGTPTGNVTIAGGGYDGGAQALASGSYTFTIPANSLPAGSLTITGSYAGDATYAEASGTASVTVTKIAPTVTVTPTPSTVGANTVVNVQINVSGPSGSSTPTGTVQLSGGGFTGGTCTLLASGGCLVQIPQNTLTNGNDTLTASYSGDSNYQSGTGTAVEVDTALAPTMTVAPSATTTTTVSTIQVAFTVTGTGPTPTGTVAIGGMYGSSVSDGTCTLTSGTCTMTVQPGSLYGGNDVITGYYSGDKTYLPEEKTVEVTVNKVTPTFSAVPSSTSIYTNDPLTINGTVSNAAVAPTGLVTFSGGAFVGDYAPVVNSQYSFVIPAGELAAGNDTITASYGGDNIFYPTSAKISIAVTQWVKVAPTIAVTLASQSIYTGQQLNVAVTVSGSGGPGTGTVTLSSGGSTLAPVTIQGGTANIPVPQYFFSPGTDTFTVSYSGDPTYLAGTATVTVTVNSSSFTLASPNSLTLSPGQQNAENVTIQTSSGYSGQITLACTLASQPSGAVDLPTCSGPTVDLSGSTEITSVLVSTIGGSASTSRPALPGPAGFGGAALAFLCFLGIPARRRGWRNLLGVLVLAFVFFSMGACGGGGGGGGGSGGGGGGGGSTGGTTAGTYTFTLTGTGSPAVTPAPTTTFTLTVN
jgi:hypothetical protein